MVSLAVTLYLGDRGRRLKFGVSETLIQKKWTGGTTAKTGGLGLNLTSDMSWLLQRRQVSVPGFPHL